MTINRLMVEEWQRHPVVISCFLLVFGILAVGGVSFWTRPTVLLTADGATRKIHPRAKTVAEALALEHITLGPEDLCVPPPSAPLVHNNDVHITRVVHRTETRRLAQPPKIYWRIHLKANLRPVQVERGFVREETQTVRYTYYDGVEKSQDILLRKIKTHPIFTLTLISKKSGYPVKTYDLTKAKRLAMRATGYYIGERTVPSDTTYLGYKLQRGLVAVDPSVIPLRSRLYVKGYGYAYAADTGSAIKGNRIDLAVKDKREENKFNRQKIDVFILEKANSW